MMKIKWITKWMIVLVLSGFSYSTFAQEEEQEGSFGATPEDSLECIKNLSLYGEFFKQDNYADALEGWKAAVEVCPKSRKSLYIRGVKMYQTFIENEGDAARKKQMIDTLMWIYDKRFENFGEECYVLGRKGSDLLKYADDAKSANALLKKAFDACGNDMEPGALFFYYQSHYKLYVKKQISKEDFLELYPTLMDVVEVNVKKENRESVKKGYETAGENMTKYFSAVADCPALVELYAPKFKATPDDIKMLKRIIKLMDAKNCNDNDLYIQVARKLNDKEPSPEAAYNIARWYAAKENCGEAIKFFQQTANLTDDNDLKLKSYLAMGSCYLFMKDYPSAKNAGQKALGVNPNSGDAYLIIGDSYAFGSKSVADNDCESKAGYWAAYDKYVKAKSVDSSVSEKADKKISIAKGQFPLKQDCFFYNIIDGTTYQVGGFINETTTVRVN